MANLPEVGYFFSPKSRVGFMVCEVNLLQLYSQKGQLYLAFYGVMEILSSLFCCCIALQPSLTKME